VNVKVQRNNINIFMSDNVIGLVGEDAGHQGRRVAAHKMIKISEGSGRMFLHHPWKHVTL
jgi:hypothetical protein